MRAPSYRLLVWHGLKHIRRGVAWRTALVGLCIWGFRCWNIGRIGFFLVDLDDAQTLAHLGHLTFLHEDFLDDAIVRAGDFDARLVALHLTERLKNTDRCLRRHVPTQQEWGVRQLRRRFEYACAPTPPLTRVHGTTYHLITSHSVIPSPTSANLNRCRILRAAHDAGDAWKYATCLRLLSVHRVWRRRRIIAAYCRNGTEHTWSGEAKTRPGQGWPRSEPRLRLDYVPSEIRIRIVDGLTAQVVVSGTNKCWKTAVVAPADLRDCKPLSESYVSSSFVSDNFQPYVHQVRFDGAYAYGSTNHHMHHTRYASKHPK